MEGTRFRNGVFQRAEGLLAAEAGEDLLMMNVELGRYFNLNSVGARIFALLEQPMTQQALVAALTNEYEVSEQVAFDELETFLGVLYERGLVTVSDGPAN